MTNDEMQNAIEFLLKNQASFEVQLEKTNRQIEQTEKQIERTQNQIEQTQNQIEQTQKQLERTDQQLAQTNQQLELTGQRVSLLAETQTEFIRTMTQHVEAQAGINADFRTMRQLARAQSNLTKTVDSLVKTVYKNGSPAPDE